MARKPLKDENTDVKTMTNMTGEDKTLQGLVSIYFENTTTHTEMSRKICTHITLSHYTSHVQLQWFIYKHQIPILYKPFFSTNKKQSFTQHLLARS
jgi:uncharacterized protein YpmS